MDRMAKAGSNVKVRSDENIRAKTDKSGPNLERQGKTLIIGQ
jgi:hypothetical protein